MKVIAHGARPIAGPCNIYRTSGARCPEQPVRIRCLHRQRTAHLAVQRSLRTRSRRCVIPRAATASDERTNTHAAVRERSSSSGSATAARLPANPAQSPNLVTADICRLFSNVNPDTLKHEPGSVLGAAALVAGTTVGAGILALPYATQEAGFAASSTALLAGAAFSAATGLLVAEVSVSTMCALGSGGASMPSMARRTLGRAGSAAASATYLFLHYALLVAYTAKAGSVLQDATGVPLPLSAAAFSAVLGGTCFASSAQQMDKINGVLVGLVVLSFLVLLGKSAGDVELPALLTAHWGALPAALPTIALAFVFQNVVPVICSSLEGDIVKVRTAILVGIAVPLAMFLSWEAAILGSVGGGGGDPLAALREGAGLAPLIDSFSLLAIVTSYIGFVLGLTDFLSDLLGLPSGQSQFVPYALTLGPPFLLARSFPDLFFSALDFAGTYGVLTLFGLLPVAMAWSERYQDTSDIQTGQLFPGGRAGLLIVGGAATFVIGNSLIRGLVSFQA